MVINPVLPWTVDVNAFRSESRYCPFHGWAVKGQATHMMVGGRLVWAL